MDLQQLQAMGAFVSNRPVKRVVEFKRPIPLPEAEWSDPDIPEFTGEFDDVTMDVFIKRMSSADQVVIATAQPEERAHATIQRLIVDESGVRVFESVEQVIHLASWMFLPLMQVVNEVTPTSPKARTSIPTTPSGSRLRSRSAAGAPRRNGGKR